MTNILQDIRDNKGANHRRIRVGRGLGSGKGKTCGRGYKGQKSRTGVSIKGFEGGQMPLYRRLPKRGFTSLNKTEFLPINLSVLQEAVDTGLFKAGQTIDKVALIESGLVRNERQLVKILSSGELTAKLTLEVDAASATAVEKIEKAGGKLVLVFKQEEQN